MRQPGANMQRIADLLNELLVRLLRLLDLPNTQRGTQVSLHANPELPSRTRTQEMDTTEA